MWSVYPYLNYFYANLTINIIPSKKNIYKHPFIIDKSHIQQLFHPQTALSKIISKIYHVR